MKEKTDKELEWDSYNHWQDYGDFAVQTSLRDYLDQPKVVIDDLANPFSLENIKDFPWNLMNIAACNTDNGVMASVHIDYEEDENDDAPIPVKHYDNTIGIGSADNDGYIPMVFKLHTYYVIGKGNSGESTQIVHICGRNICETVNDLGMAMADMARDVYRRAVMQLDNPIPVLEGAKEK